MYSAFDDIHIWFVLGLNRGRSHFKIFRCSNELITQKVYFSRLIRVYVSKSFSRLLQATRPNINF
jgi:hypothetical protein